jgi:L-lactate dehydrogenase complex protein LldF
VRIPIPKMLVRMRREAVNHDPASAFRDSGAQRRPGEAAVWKAWARIHATPGLYSLVTRTATAFKKLPVLGPLKAWSSVRTPPRTAGRTLHQRLAGRERSP